MNNLRHLKKRVRLIKNSKKVTNALQMIAVSKMKHARRLLSQIQTYSDTIVDLMQKIASRANHEDISEEIKKFFISSDSNKHTLVVLFAPTKGFCGALISNLNEFLNSFIKQNKNKVRSIGLHHKSRFILESLNDLVIDAIFENPVSDETRFELEAEFQYILKGYFSGDYEDVFLIYPKFVSVFKYKIVKEQLLPLNKKVFDDIFQHNKVILNNTQDIGRIQSANVPEGTKYIEMEPSVELLFKEALERYLINRLTYATVNTKASEFSARAITMRSATENAEKLEQHLELEFNKMRQSAITTNLLDIVGGLLK